MTLNYIWISFFIVAFVVAIVKFIFLGDTEIFKSLVDATFSSSKTAVMDISLPLVGIMTLWLGIMHIGEKAGAIRFLSRIVGPFFNKLFPEIPKNHPVNGQIMMNFSANMLGLDNAATPLGLKAMEGMQELNKDKETASNAQIMFLVLNTSGLTIIPVTILAQRAIMGAANPADVFVPVLIATYCSTLVGLIAVAFKQKINLFHTTLLSWIAAVTAVIAGLVFWFTTLTPDQISKVSNVSANFILFSIIVAFICGGWYKKINVYSAFIEGAKSGFEVSVKIIPYLVAMLVGIAVFRASGAMTYLVEGIVYVLNVFNINSDFAGALPTAFMKPLSGSGAKAMMLESMQHYGADSFVGRLSCVFQGAADTTFYIVALYFGAVGIRKTRYAVAAGLIADLAGVIAAIGISYLFFH